MTRKQLHEIIEDPKNFLARGHKIDRRIRNKKERIEAWRAHAESITVNIGPVTGKSGKGPPKTIEIAIAKIDEIQQELIEEITELAIIEREVSGVINNFITDSIHKTILEMRFLNYMTLYEVSEKLGYTYRWTQKLCRQALINIKEDASRRAENAV